MRISRRMMVVGMMLPIAAALILLRIYDPATSTLFPPCPVYFLTGWYCPGCGSLRAMHQLLHGQVRVAWAMNPLSVPLFPFLAYGLAAEAMLYARGRKLPLLVLPGAWIRALCAAILLFGIARNLPFHPFNLLAPGGMLKF